MQFISLFWQEEFKDTKGIIRFRKSKTNRQHNSQKEKNNRKKQRSTKHTHKTKDRVTGIPLKTGCSCSTSGTRRVNLVANLLQR